MMGYLKRLVLYIVIMVMSVFIIGCDKSSDTAENPKEGSKEAQIKKSFSKTLDMYQLRISRIYMTKKDIVMANLKKVIKGLGQYQQILLKATSKVK